MSKILEKIVAVKLTNHLQLNNLLYKHQYGFQRGLSTEHNLLHVVNYISNAINNGKYCIGVFLDLRKAFDVCSHEILLKKLKIFCIFGKELAWFNSYLKNRRQKVDINGILSNEEIINISVLQGTSLGPILFLCYINDLFTTTNLATYLFADDTSCLAEDSDLDTLINYVNTELQKISNWFDSNKMALNISKTKYIIFRSRGKKINTNLNIVMNTNEIGKSINPDKIFPIDRIFSNNPSSDNRAFKLLGVYFDEYMSFEKHINVLCAKLSRANYCIKRVYHKLSQKSLKCLYYALFHPHLLYCINIYSCATHTNLKKITILQKKAIRIINKEKNNSHTSILFKKSQILTFDNLILQAKLHIMHSIVYNYAPKTFLNMFTLNNTNTNYNLRNRAMFLLPQVKLEMFKRFPLFTLPSTWNTAGDITFQYNKITFQIALKNLLLSDLFDNQRNI